MNEREHVSGLYCVKWGPPAPSSATSDRFFSLMMSNIPLCVYMCVYIHTHTNTTICYLFICWQASRLIPYLSYCEQCYNRHAGIPSACISFGYISRSVKVVSYDTFFFWWNLHNVLHRGCIYLHSHQQYIRILLFQHLCQHFFFFFFLITAILTGLRWNLSVASPQPQWC